MTIDDLKQTQVRLEKKKNRVTDASICKVGPRIHKIGWVSTADTPIGPEDLVIYWQRLLLAEPEQSIRSHLHAMNKPKNTRQPRGAYPAASPCNFYNFTARQRVMC